MSDFVMTQMVATSDEDIKKYRFLSVCTECTHYDTEACPDHITPKTLYQQEEINGRYIVVCPARKKKASMVVNTKGIVFSLYGSHETHFYEGEKQ